MEEAAETADPSMSRNKQLSLLVSEDSLLWKDEKSPLICQAISFHDQDNRTISTPRARQLPHAFQVQQGANLVNTIQLVGLTFFCVCGGPFGFEDTIKEGGAVLMLVGLFLFPLFWSAPLALMTVELSSMIPESGGHVLWVYRAFGPFWSFVNGFYAFTGNVLDNALYPVLFVEYLSALLYEKSGHISTGSTFVIKIFVLFLATILNVFGIGIVGTVVVVLAVAVLAPFITMTILGLPHLNFNWANANIPKPMNWGRFLTLLLWNTSGFDAAGTFASEVRNPGYSYPRALFVSVMLISAAFALPSVIGVSVFPNYALWRNGTFTLAAKLIGGNSLKVCMGLSETLGALGLLLTRLCTSSRIMYGMAVVEQVPSVFSWLHPRFRTPWPAILLTSTCTVLVIGFSAYSLAEADMLFYALSTVIKFSALVQLRFTEPDAFRPFRIPFDRKVLAVLTAIPIGVCTTMIYFASDRSQIIVLIGSLVAVFGYMAKESVTQFGMETGEAVQRRMARVQANIGKMQHGVHSEQMFWGSYAGNRTPYIGLVRDGISTSKTWLKHKILRRTY